MKIYLETTVPNFLFAEDAPEKQEATTAFWRWLKLSNAEVFISQIVLDEIVAAPPARRAQLLAALEEVDCAVLQLNSQAVGVADRLVRAGIVPVRYADDARHIAVALVYEMDVLASWNFQHIVKLKTMAAVSELAAAYGLKPPRLLTPQEILP